MSLLCIYLFVLDKILFGQINTISNFINIEIYTNSDKENYFC